MHDVGPKMRGGATGVRLSVVILGVSAVHAALSASLCPAPELALRDMVTTEYAFAAAAKDSIRSAFLSYLAPDALVLEPYPRPAVAVYTAAKETKDSLEWYPTQAEIAGSGNLGFTTGPWTHTSAEGGARSFGRFLTLWRRDALCAWHVELDGGVTGVEASNPDTPLTPAGVKFVAVEAPVGALITADALDHAIADFQHVAQTSGAAAAFRTYGHNGPVQLLVDGLPPIDSGGPVTDYLTAHPVSGVWKETGHGRSGDATLAYTVGEVYDAKMNPTHAYIQVWVYDPKVANWGLRLLLLSRLPAH